MTITDANFLYAMTNIRQQLFRFLARELSKKGVAGVAPSSGDILFVLDRRGPLTMQEVARYTIKDKSTVSSVVNRLESLGYVAKERDGADARRTNLSLTSRAKKLRPVLLEISKKMNTMMFQGFSEEEKQTLFRLMEKVYKNL